MLRSAISTKLPMKNISFLCLSLSVIVTLLLGLAPLVGPDSQDLLMLVKNMTEYGCFSYSSQCIPTTSDLGPGYPVLIYILNLFVGLDTKAIVFVQGLSFCAVAFVLAYYISSSYKFGARSLGVICCIVLLNPLLIGWNRFIHPDLIVYLLVILMMIMLDRFTRSGNARELLAYSLLVSIGSLFRYEFIIFSTPVIAFWVSSFFLRRPLILNGLLPGALCGLVVVCFVGLGLWSLRNLSLGLPALRDGYFFLNSERNLTIEGWIKSWTISQWDYSVGLYPYFSGKLDLINPPAWATSETIQSNLASTSSFVSSSLESLIENKTRQINSSAGLVFSINFRRVIWLLFNPFWSAGLADLFSKSWESSIPDFAGYLFSKLYSLCGRLTVFSLAVIALFRLNRCRLSRLKVIIFFSMVIVLLIYILLLLSLCQLETRYLTAPLLALSLASAMIMAQPKSTWVCR